MDILEYIKRVNANFDKQPEPRYNTKKYFTDNVDDIGPGPNNRNKIPRLNVMPEMYNSEEQGSGVMINPRGLQDGKIPLPTQGLNEGGIATPKRGLVDGPGSYAGRKVSEERLKFLNEAAEKYGYKDFESVEGRSNRINVAKDATRREKGVSEGKGRPGVEKDYQVKTGEKDLASDAYLQRDLKRTKNQDSILKAVQSGKYKTAEEIRKFTKLNKPNFNKEVKNLFKNVYTQIGDLNKPKKSQMRFGVRFLPRDLDQLYEMRSQLGQIEGFESTEQRTIYKTIEEAYGQKGTNPNRKAFAEATKKASDFSRIKNQINKKYPSINLELEHPLDYKTIKGLGKGGEKFLFVTPIEKSINRGFKATLGDAYAKAVKAKDKANILKIENLAQDIGVTIGQVRGSKVMDYGTGPLRTTNLGDEIIANLRQQNVIVDNIKKLQKSGELKTRLTDIGMPRAGETGYSTKKVSESQMKGIKKIIESIGCPNNKAMGGRIDFQTGTNCMAKGVEAINSGKIAKGAQARNFANFANRAYKLGRGIMKFGVIPEALFVAGESLVRMGMGDTLDEAFLRSTDWLRFGDQTKEAETRALIRTIGPENAQTVLRANDYKQALTNLNDAKANAEVDLAQNMEEFSGESDETIRIRNEQRIKNAEANIKEKFQPEYVMDAAVMKEAESQDIRGVNNPIKKFFVKARQNKIDDIEQLMAPEKVKRPAAPMSTMDDYANQFDDEYLEGLRTKYKNPNITKKDILRAYREDEDFNKGVFQSIFEEGRLNLANRERLFGTQGEFASGGMARASFGIGGFTKAQFIIQRMKNSLKQALGKTDADSKYVKDTFPNMIKELEAKPELANNENVFKAFSEDLPKDQRIVVHSDDSVDFFTQSKFGPHNIKSTIKFAKDNNISIDEANRILKMEPEDQVLEKTRLQILKDRGRTRQAEGGLTSLTRTIPPERGPNSQGLAYFMKNGKR